jgi:hypothetical protein
MIRVASRLATTALALAILTGAAFAQGAALSQSHLAAARDVITSSGMSRSFEIVIPQFEQRIRQQLVSRPQLSGDLDAVFKELQPEMQLQEQAMVNRAATVMAQRLTEDELKQISTFFSSAVGKRYVETQPAVLDDLVKEMQSWSNDLAEYLQIRVRAEMSKRGHQMQ